MQNSSFDLLHSVASNVMHSQGLHSFTINPAPECYSIEESPASKSRMKENKVKEDIKRNCQ